MRFDEKDEIPLDLTPAIKFCHEQAKHAFQEAEKMRKGIPPKPESGAAAIQEWQQKYGRKEAEAATIQSRGSNFDGLARRGEIMLRKLNFYEGQLREAFGVDPRTPSKP